MTLNDGYAYETRIERGRPSVLDFLSSEFQHSTRETWSERLAAGELELDGQTISEDQRLTAGQRLIWHRPPWTEEPVPLHFEVLYEDADLLAVGKPSGLPTMPGGGFLKHTLLALVRQGWPEASPLHRLGRGTSGVVLFSLKAAAAGALLADWREHRIQKLYIALAAGIAAQDRYDIRVPIGPVPHAKLREVHAASLAGKPAHSLATVLERQSESTRFQVEIFTGRPHQIRIHLASIGHPLIGDPLYAPGGSPLPDALPGDLGYLLHAHTLGFTHPRTGERLTLSARVPF